MEDFHLLPALPRLQEAGFKITSDRDANYNRVAWAANDTSAWWRPDEDGYWPESVAREESLAALVAAFATLGYSVCSDGRLEAGFEKIAIYGNDRGPQHVARQLASGSWTSKLGRFEDIEHATPDGVDCASYGTVVSWLRRPTSV